MTNLNPETPRRSNRVLVLRRLDRSRSLVEFADAHPESVDGTAPAD
ncbi:MAG: hypothetical protein AB8A39_01260 [Prochlorococcus sp.]